MKFEFKVSKKAVETAYEKEVEKAVKNTKIKGFRKGSAPKDMVVKSIGKEDLQQRALEAAIPDAYAAALKKNKVKPITYPKLTLKQGKIGEDFTFEAEVAESPDIKLGDYKKELKGLLASSKIWTPEKGSEKDTEKKEPSREEKADIILRKLLEKITFEVPEILVEREVNRRLTQIVNQVNNIGMKMEDYLDSVKKSKDDLKAEQEEVAKQTIAIEFILMEIARDLKVEATNEDIDALIENIGDPKMAKSLQTPEERANIFVMLTKQKAVDELLKISQ